MSDESPHRPAQIREGDPAPGGANCMFRCAEWCAECAEQELAAHLREMADANRMLYSGHSYKSQGEADADVMEAAADALTARRSERDEAERVLTLLKSAGLVTAEKIAEAREIVREAHALKGADQ